MAVKLPDFKVKHGLQVGGDANFSKGLTALSSVHVGGAFTLDGNATTQGNLTIAGNLVVNGDTTTVDTTAIAVEDPLLSLGTGNEADILDIGFYGKYNTGAGAAADDKYAGIFRDASDGGLFKLFDSLSAEPTNSVSAAAASFNMGSLKANLSGLAVSATKLNHQHTWQLVGEVTGSQATDYSGALSQISTTIPNNTISGNHINAAAVGATQLASDAVTTVKINNQAVTDNKLISSTSTDANRAVGAPHIKDDALQTRHFSAGVVSNSHLANDGITVNGVDVSLGGSITVGLTGLTDTNSINFTFQEPTTHPAIDIVSADVIVKPTGVLEIDSDGMNVKDDSIDNIHIKDNAVSNSRLSAGAVTTVKIVDDAVTNAKIASPTFTINGVAMELGGSFTINTLTEVKDTPSINMHLSTNGDVLSADVVVADNTLEVVSSGGLSGVRIKAGGLSATHFTTDCVLASSIAASQVTTVKINDEAVTFAKLGLSAVQSTSISGDTIRTDHIKDGVVTRVKIADDAVNDAKIDLDNADFKTLSNTSVVSSSYTTIDSSLTASYRSVHYFVQANEGSDWQSSHVTLMHNGSDAYIMEHGIVSTKSDGEPFVTFDASMASNSLNLRAQSSGNGASIKAIKSGLES